MLSIEDVAEKVLEAIDKAVVCATKMAESELATPHERQMALKTIMDAAKIMIDRRWPKLTANKEVRMDLTHLIEKISPHFPPGAAKAALEVIDMKELPTTAAGRPKTFTAE